MSFSSSVMGLKDDILKVLDATPIDGEEVAKRLHRNAIDLYGCLYELERNGKVKRVYKGKNLYSK